MKKIIALILAGLMLLSFAACAKNDNENGDKPTTTVTEANGDADTTTTGTEEKKEPTELELSKKASVAKIAEALLAKYEEYTNLRGTYEEYMAELDEADRMPYEEFRGYQLHTGPVEDMEYGLVGIPTLPEGIGEVHVYQPSMGTIPFIGYVFRVAEGTDVETFKKALLDNCDRRWNFCTEANTAICENFGEIVWFTMMNIANDENPDGFTAEQKDGFHNAFVETAKIPADAE